MNSKKSMWVFRAMRGKITKSGRLTVTDQKAVVSVKGVQKPALSSKAKALVKKFLRKKARQANWSLLKGFE